MTTKTVAKFECGRKSPVYLVGEGTGYAAYDEKGRYVDNEQRRVQDVELSADAEDHRFFNSTPQGHIKLQVANLSAVEIFEPSKKYRVTFEKWEDWMDEFPFEPQKPS